MWGRVLKRFISTATVKRQMINNNIAELILSDPSTKNAIGYDIAQALENNIQALKKETEVGCVIIRSDSPEYFCSGGNIKERAKMTQDEVDAFTSRIRSLLKEIELLPMPTIALLSGGVLGNGFEISLAADMRVLSKETTMRLPQCRIGSIPGLGGITRLTKLIGIARAKELVFCGKKIDSATALSLGIANAVEDTYELARERCIKIGKEILKGSGLAVREAKQVFLKINDNLEWEGYEAEGYRRMIKNKERQEALNRFVEKKAPKML